MGYDGDNVLKFSGITTRDLPPELILREAAKVKFQRVLVIGVTEDGKEYHTSSAADGGTVLWDMERVRHRLMKMSDD